MTRPFFATAARSRSRLADSSAYRAAISSISAVSSAVNAPPAACIASNRARISAISRVQFALNVFSAALRSPSRRIFADTRANVSVSSGADTIARSFSVSATHRSLCLTTSSSSAEALSAASRADAARRRASANRASFAASRASAAAMRRSTTRSFPAGPDAATSSDAYFFASSAISPARIPTIFAAMAPVRVSAAYWRSEILSVGLKRSVS